jgi:hypothetical protein
LSATPAATSTPGPSAFFRRMKVNKNFVERPSPCDYLLRIPRTQLYESTESLRRSYQALGQVVWSQSIIQVNHWDASIPICVADFPTRFISPLMQ